MNGAQAARHSAADDHDRGDWANTVRYYHGLGEARPRSSHGAGFAAVIFVLALLTALALLDHFA